MLDNKKYRDALITRTYNFSLAVIKFVREAPPRDFAAQVIAKQLIRSATSIGANIMEAQASPTRKDFSNFMNHALKSANESRYWLGLLRDTSTGENLKIVYLLTEAQEFSKMLGSTVISLKQK